MTADKPTVFLIASQMPQQELGIIAQLLQSQGFAQARDDKAHPGVLAFRTKDNDNEVVIRFYQEVGALRLELKGPVSQQIGMALGQYMPPLTAAQIEEIYEQADSDMYRRIYAMLMVLTYPDATTAMAAMHETYFDKANTATREGVIQGLAFMESPDVGPELEKIEKAYKGDPIADLARKAINGLSERGLVRESSESFCNKVRAQIEDNPKAALDLIKKYEEDAPAPEVRALHAKALRLLGNIDAAGKLLFTIHPNDPDCVEAWCERALLHESAGLLKDAMFDVEMALKQDPDNAEASAIMRRIGLLINQAESSDDDKLKHLSQALDAHPDDVNLRCQRGECLLSMNKPDDALTDLLTAQKSAPNDPRIPLLLAETYLAKGFLGFALDYATRAQKSHVPTQEVAAWLLKPRVFLAIGLPQKAHDAMHEIPAPVRAMPESLLCEAIIDEQLGQTDECTKLYDLVGEGITLAFESIRPRLYADLPILRRYLGVSSLDIAPKPERPLDKEPIDPFFKRCDACGALTMQRRTYCRECANGSFFC